MKNIWIFNHYAGPPSICSGLRHFYFAKYLIQAGYKVIIFASSAQHNSDINLITDDKPYIKYKEEDVPFVYIKTRQYTGNGKKRILNMVDYYLGLLRITKEFEKPDIIIGSSVHPLACLAAIKLSKKYKCKNIIEIRDLWPESLVEYKIIKKNALPTKLLYKLEKFIYYKANKLIFTMEGGYQYIIDKKWNSLKTRKIDLGKIYHINNGVDLEEFEKNKRSNEINDIDLEDKNSYKIVLTGSIRKADNIGLLVDVAEELNNESKYNKIKFIIYGDGEELKKLSQKCIDKKLNNICFKGKVNKKCIPYILEKCDLTMMCGMRTNIGKYGLSLNKSFEYLASGKPILSTIECAYDYISSAKAGITVDASIEGVTAGVKYFYNLSDDNYNSYCKNAKKLADKYSYKNLTNQLIEIFNSHI